MIEQNNTAGGYKPTLEEAVEAAFERQQQRHVLLKRNELAQAMETHARGILPDNPALDLSVKSDQVGSDQGYREYEAGIVFPIWDWGQKNLRRQIAKSTRSSVLQDREVLRLQVAGAVRETVWHAALLNNALNLAQKEWDTAQTLEQNVEKRVRMGELAKTDLLLAKTDSLQKQSAWLQAQADFAAMLNRYRLLTGYQALPRKRFEVTTEILEIGDDHPLMAAAQAGIYAAQAQSDAVISEQSDNLSVYLGGRRERGAQGEDFSNSLALGINMPFAQSKYRNKDHTESQLAVTQAEADRYTLHRELQGNLFAARKRLEALQQRYTLAEQQNGIAQENLRLANIAFNAGEIDLVRLLQVQTVAFAAERNAQQLRIERQRAVARLNQAAGLLP
jgi:outer membrane protein TolC